MESGDKKTRHAGGRPKKAVRRDQQLAVMCTRLERKVVEMKAGVAGMSVSEFLRALALKGKVNARAKALPKEVLLFTATLNHLAANLNQVARWRNRGDTLTALERAELQVLSGKVRQLALDIKSFLK
jgi:hypothetical protein